MGTIFGFFGLGKKDASAGNAVINPVSKVASSEEKNDLSAFNRRLIELETKISGYKTYTSPSRDPSGQLDHQTRQILKDHAGSDVMAAVFEELANLSWLKMRFEEDERFVNSGQGPHLKTFDSKKDDTLKRINMLYGISQLISSRILNSGAKNSIENVYKNFRKTAKYAVDEEIVIKVLVAYVQVAESAKKFFDDICKRRETAKLATTAKKNNLPFSRN